MMYRVLCALLCASVAAGGVVDLTSQNFDSTIGESKLVFVKFYAPWCGHCKRLAPDWEKLGDEVNKDKVIVAKIDCTEESEVCSKYGVSGYPTLKYWTKDATKPEDYNGGRSLDDLQDFVAEQLGGGCGPDDKDACSDKEKEYLEEWAAKGASACQQELNRLEGLKNTRARTADQLSWYKSRMKLLRQLK
eukprot:TRINITY_DN196_c0_g3_i2.p1 TRINITY_DN196_c0_g3~~TRINITY_DN196_c0_g3_i2.p1  ORF type:complete len:200 (+),score=85.21 TRINITY_DN196_c0_g3_i2:33-602(+)